MKRKLPFSCILFCSFFISCISMSNIKKNEIINLNPTLFHKEDKCTFIGKMNISPKRYVEIYFIEHLFGNARASYRLVFFDNNNSISCYRIEDRPILMDKTLLFPYKKELGNEIKIENEIPDKIYLNGEAIDLFIIK